MQSDDDLQTTLSKWPFILGDVLLVATALAIAILGQWQLTNWQVASCVVSVALGAGLFVLPYIVEFQTRVREEAEDRSADLRILQRHITSSKEQLEAVGERIESLEAGLSNLARAKPDLSTPIQAIEAKVEPLTDAQAEQSAEVKALAEKVELLTNSFNTKPAREEITVLRSELVALKAQLEALPEPALDAPKADEPTVEENKPLEASPAEPITKKAREPRQRRTPEPRLLQRAIEQKQDNSSAAVSRIIESKSKMAEFEPKASASQEEPIVEEARTEPKPKEAPKPEEAPRPEKEPVADKEEEAFASEEERSEVIEPEELNPKPEAKPQPAPKAAPEDDEAKAPKTEDMFAHAVPVQPKQRVRMKKSDTALIASVFIGIGNKPFVRGSGAGLNWDSGTSMEFEEIGKWCWKAPSEMDQPIEIQLYRNDEDPDSKGKYTLEPGQQLEVSPVFET